MQVNYEGAKFKVGLSASIERKLIKKAIKRRLKRLVNRPHRQDGYLKLAEKQLSTLAHPVVVDVGANIGTTVLPLALKFPNAHFYAIEPHPLPLSRLICNCALNQVRNVTLLSMAVGSNEKIAEIFTCPSNSGGHRLTGFKGREDVEKITTYGAIKVPVLPLSFIFKELKIEHCDLLKIDTEGFDYFVLESAEEFLCPKSISAILVEYGPEGLRCAGKSGADLFNLLHARGYQCKRLGEEKIIQTEKDLPFVEDFSVTDLFFY